MGVTNLWQILEPVRQPVSLSSLKGKTLAVDLSLWVCEAQTVKKMIGVVTKPHLRYGIHINYCSSYNSGMILVPNLRQPSKFIWLFWFCCYHLCYICKGLRWRLSHIDWIQLNTWVQTEVLGPSLPCLGASAVDKDEMDISRTIFVLLSYSTVI